MNHTTSRAVMIAITRPQKGDEEAYHYWYDYEHLPDRLRVPGILAAARYVVNEPTTKYIGCYELADQHVLRATSYRILHEQRTPEESRILENLDFLERFVGLEWYAIGSEHCPTFGSSWLSFHRWTGRASLLDELRSWLKYELAGAIAGQKDSHRVRIFDELEPDRSGSVMAIVESNQPLSRITDDIKWSEWGRRLLSETATTEYQAYRLYCREALHASQDG